MAIDGESVNCPEPGPALGWVIDHPGPWFALVWLPVLLLAPVIDSVAGADPRGFFLLALAASYVLAVTLPFRPGPHRSWESEAAFLMLLLTCTAALLLRPQDRNFVFPLLAIGAAAALRARWAPSFIAAIAISGSVTTGLDRGSLAAALVLGFATLMAGTATYLIRYLTGVIGELTRTRELLAQTAVGRERLRFARDLHDLLGHSLSLLVVKAEAGRRLLVTDPAAAMVHVNDIERIGRTALAEVRGAVDGYRSLQLGEELAGVHTALASRGIRVDIASAPLHLEAGIDELLAWAVREATTNVIRHARATECRITVGTPKGAVRLEITDNGVGGPFTEGNGLLGMRERAAQLGGTLEAGPVPAGFRLALTVPRHPTTGGTR